MQALNQRLVNQPLLDFINATLRGISQVILVNNPLSGLLILAAMFIQSPRLGGMSLVGTPDPGPDDIYAFLWLLSLVKSGLAELVAVSSADGNVAAKRTFSSVRRRF